MAMRSLLPYPWSRNGLQELQRDPFTALHQQINRLFDDFGTIPAGRATDQMEPSLDVSETENEFMIDADLPGIDEKNVEVTLSGDVLTIHGERQNGHETKEKNYHLSERSWGSFTRQVGLPFEADPRKVIAKFEKGVLHISIPKPEEIAAKTTRIPVRPA